MRFGREEYGEAAGRGAVRLERLLPGPIERVWEYLTDGEKRATWLAGGEMELRVGGRVEHRFHHPELSHEKEPPQEYRRFDTVFVMHGTVTRCEPPRLLSYTWGGGDEVTEVTFELTPTDEGVRLVVTHRRLARPEDMAEVAAGWHAHLGLLADRLEGREPRGFWTAHMRAKAEYDARFASADGAPAGG